MNTEKSTGRLNSSFKERFKSNVSKRWPIFVGLIIADFAIDFLTGGGFKSFWSTFFLVNALVGSLILYFIIVVVISAIKR